MSTNQSSLSTIGPGQPSSGNIPRVQSIFDLKGVLSTDKSQALIVNLPNSPNLGRAGVARLIDSTNPGRSQKRSDPTRLDDCSSPSLGSKPSPSRKVRLNPAVSQNIARAYSSCTQRASNLKIPPISRVGGPCALTGDCRFPSRSSCPASLQINLETTGDTFIQTRYLPGLHVEVPNYETRLSSGNHSKLTPKAVKSWSVSCSLSAEDSGPRKPYKTTRCINPPEPSGNRQRTAPPSLKKLPQIQP